MDELILNQQLYEAIVDYMKPKYSLTTQRQRQYFLIKIFKKYGVLNQENLKIIMRGIKYQHQRACLSMINDYCYDNDISFNLRIPSTKGQDSKLPTLLTINEIDLMIKSTPKPYDLAIRCIFNMGAGLRISEIIKFSWDHIRWLEWINNQDTYGVAVIKAGKGSKDRVVNIPRKLMKDLYNYAVELDILNEFRIPTGSIIFPFGQFTSIKEKEMEDLFMLDKEKWKAEYVLTKYNWFRNNILEKYCEKALNRKIKIHQLRHSRATYLHEYEGVPIEKLKVLLGHSNLNTTMIYTKINPKGVFDTIKETKEI